MLPRIKLHKGRWVPVIIWVFVTLVWVKFPSTAQTDSVIQLNEFTLQSSASFLDGWPARAEKSQIHVVVEIPAGTSQKWEVTKPDGRMVWELKKGKRRIVQYLPYPANYGMVPQTMLPEKIGGDGDPLDVILLGPALPRGTVAIGRVIGVLDLLDDGEQDDKLIAVCPESPFGEVENLKALDRQFPGTLSILETWFKNYKGPGRVETLGFRGNSKAERILKQAIQAYSKI